MDTTSDHAYPLTDEDTAVTVNTYVRPTLLLEPMDAKLATLQTLEEDDIVDAVEIDSWPGKVTLARETGYDSVVSLFDRFERWAEDADVSICPPFEMTATTSEFREETRRILRTPIMCIAISVDETLAGVFPHTDGDTEYGVTEAIAALRTGSLAERLSPGIVEATTYETCPDCAGQLVDIHGVQLCHDCAWTNWDDVAGGDRARKLQPAGPRH